MSDLSADQPVFPLNIPLFPMCKMQLQIFEQRYLNMISNCLSNQGSFIVALLCEGNERQEVMNPKLQSRPPEQVFYPLGTEAKVVDFDQRENGLLLITIEGQSRKKLSDIKQQEDGLWCARTEELREVGSCNNPVPDHWQQILVSLAQSSPLPWFTEDNVNTRPTLALNYLSMYLPIRPMIKQNLLEIDQLNSRWLQLNQLLEES